ncbi:hypothetical protein ETU08_07645 [Apibacter muscae]|uniref:Teneurin-like YD-shell domain-containing protein n=1 Tax=Apibacter muscae TaxID=2509004 RepID=A0A563DA17_9FLAO|nr:RHS repeat domain-containing protein [Apibacter muscae]TWP27060.1 hypothetical protein ETU09_08040 [Apibacter muscae]TWP29365.1 hypothetical protein ETU08_07645 [Apibacter muscae]
MIKILENNRIEIYDGLESKELYNKIIIENIKLKDILENDFLNLKDKLVKETDEEGLETLHNYDELGNLTKTTLPDESTYTFAYDSESRLILATDPSGNHTKWTYYNNRLHSTESDGKSTRFLYNEQNLISTIRNHWEEETHLQYDSQYNLVELTNPLKKTTRWKYNSLGECTEVINPLGNKQQFEYNRLGRLSKVKLPNSEIIDLKYDAYDSILRVNSLHSKINYTYTPLGSIRSREEKGVKVFFEYDVTRKVNCTKQ